MGWVLGEVDRFKVDEMKAGIREINELPVIFEGLDKLRRQANRMSKQQRAKDCRAFLEGLDKEKAA